MYQNGIIKANIRRNRKKNAKIQRNPQKNT
jgi:hypothetical protein